MRLHLSVPFLLGVVALFMSTVGAECPGQVGDCRSAGCVDGFYCHQDGLCKPACEPVIGTLSGDEGAPCQLDIDCSSPLICDNNDGGATCVCVSSGAGGNGGSGGTACAPLGNTLRIVLDWESSDVDLDLGGETPRDNDLGNNFGAGDPAQDPTKDPNCLHDGDEPNTSGMTVERVTCQPLDDDPATYAGTYLIRVDNFSEGEQAYELLVTVDSVDVPGFAPRAGTVPGIDNGSAGFVHETFCLE